MYELKKVSIASVETIAYRNCGSGDKKILLIHGNQCSSTIYQEFMQKYEDKASVYAIDLAGFGESTYNNPHKKMEDWAKDVKEFMDELELENAIIVGHSAGGGVGLKLASNYPDKVGELVLIASVGVKGFYLPMVDENFIPIEGKFARTYEEVAGHPSMIFVENLIKSKDKIATKQMWDASLYNLKAPNEDLYQIYMDEFFKERCFTDISVALCQFNITNEGGDGSIEKITCPTTWIHGKKDQVVPFVIGQNSAIYFLNDLDFIAIDEAGHMVFNDCPEEFYGHIDGIVEKYAR